MRLVDGARWFDVGAELILTAGFVLAGLLAIGIASASRGIRTPQSAWARAMVYFGICWLLAWMTGVTPTVFSDPVATSEQVESSAWWFWLLASVAIVVIAYGVIWPKGTRTHGRALAPGWVVAFALLWGSSQGQLYVAFWAVAERVLEPGWVAGVVAFVVISAFTGVWHDKYWDRLVSPEHNIASWNGKKVALCHVPNLIVTLLFLGRHGNVAIFVALQTLALGLSCWFMRFPPPAEVSRAN